MRGEGMKTSEKTVNKQKQLKQHSEKYVPIFLQVYSIFQHLTTVFYFININFCK